MKFNNTSPATQFFYELKKKYLAWSSLLGIKKNLHPRISTDPIFMVGMSVVCLYTYMYVVGVYGTVCSVYVWYM